MESVTTRGQFGFFEIPPVSNTQLTARYIVTSEVSRESQRQITAYWTDDDRVVELPSRTTSCEAGERLIKAA